MGVIDMCSVCVEARIVVTVALNSSLPPVGISIYSGDFGGIVGCKAIVYGISKTLAVRFFFSVLFALAAFWDFLWRI